MLSAENLSIWKPTHIIGYRPTPLHGRLNLEAAVVETDERGAVKVNERLQTTNPRVWAIGDVKGGLQFTYISLDDYRIIREDLFGDSARSTADRDPVGYSVFIDPPLSRIGLNEEEALRKGLNVKIGKLPVAGIPRARTLGETEGLFKVVIDADTNKIVAARFSDRNRAKCSTAWP